MVLIKSKMSSDREIKQKLKVLGKNVRYLRKSQNLSLESLSAQINISVKILTEIESGADFAGKYLVYLSNFYHVLPSALFSETFIKDASD